MCKNNLLVVVIFLLMLGPVKGVEAYTELTIEQVYQLGVSQLSVNKIVNLFRGFYEIICEDKETFTFCEIDIKRRYLHTQLTEDVKRLEKAYPNLLKAEVIGLSEDGREIYLLKLGKGEKKSLMMGGVHAREIAATPLLMKMINEYARHYYLEQDFEGFNVRDLLDQTTLYIVPQVNPDGMEIAIHGNRTINNPELKKALENMGGSFEEWKANARGVDLNRNFACQYWGYDPAWGFKRSPLFSPLPHAEFYCGNCPASEKETQAIQELMRNNDFKILFDLHSRGRTTYWFKPERSEEINKITEILAEELSKYSGYSLVPKSFLMPGRGTNGSTTDFADTLGIYPLTIETLPFKTTFPVDIQIIEDEWELVKCFGLILACETLKF